MPIVRLSQFLKLTISTPPKLRVMKVSIRCVLCVVAFVATWLGALASGSPVAVELISTASFVAIISTLGFAIFDSNNDRRPFWTGFFICGIGFMFAAFFTSMQESTDAMTAFLCNLSGAQFEPDFSVPQPFPATPGLVNGNKINLTPSYNLGVLGPFAYRQSVSQAVPVMSAVVAALAGGIATRILSKGKSSP